jgi:hypothetical protein
MIDWFSLRAAADGNLPYDVTIVSSEMLVRDNGPKLRLVKRHAKSPYGRAVVILSFACCKNCNA